VKPARLFHYQRFVEAHFVSLLAGQLKLSRPDCFNDPWDCRVHYQLPTEPGDTGRLFAYLTEIHRKRDPEVSEAERQRWVAELMVNPSKLQAAFVRLEKDMYAALCRQYRIYCLSEDPASPLMWGHYAASHTGICLEFDARRDPFPAVEQVEYRATYPAYQLPTVGYKPLITKAMHWSYEAEWRLIAEERSAAISLVTIKTNIDFLTLPTGVLKSVTIGALANESSRRLIQDLVNRHSTGVAVRQAAVALDRYELTISPPF
jgi:hypothetical protein